MIQFDGADGNKIPAFALREEFGDGGVGGGVAGDRDRARFVDADVGRVDGRDGGQAGGGVAVGEDVQEVAVCEGVGALGGDDFGLWWWRVGHVVVCAGGAKRVDGVVCLYGWTAVFKQTMRVVGLSIRVLLT